MTLRLTVDRNAWSAHVHATVADYALGLIPVVKGNGYGFGRPTLHRLAIEAGHTLVCVGTVHELHDVPAELTPVVLTPSLAAPDHPAAVPTVGSVQHVAALAGWQGQVVVKLASSMRRYGVAPDQLAELTRAVSEAGLSTMAFGLHLPLAGDDTARLTEIEAWLPHLSANTPLWVSHLTPESLSALRSAHAHRTFAVRVGTALWHGVPRRSFLHLSADVVHTQAVSAGETAGYWHTQVPHDGTLVAIGAGSAHGLALLDETDPARRSPLHFQRHRLPLLERPHMHTTLALVPHGQPCPAVGDRVDVQRPLITSAPDLIEWT